MLTQIRIYLLMLLVGYIFGSFGSVLLTRLESPTRDSIKSIIIGRSQCPGCKHVLSPKELIPLYSYRKQSGQCSNCHRKIPDRYRHIELICGIVFLGTYSMLYHSGITSATTLILWLTINRLLTLIIIYDARKQLLHMSIWLLSLVPTVGLIRTSNTRYNSIIASLIFIVPTILIYIGAKYRAQTKYNEKEGFGQGDIYLLGSLGLLVPVILSYHDISGGYRYIMYYLRTLIIGSTLTILLWTIQKNKKKEIAFLPGVIIGFWIVGIFAKVLL